MSTSTSKFALAALALAWLSLPSLPHLLPTPQAIACNAGNPSCGGWANQTVTFDLA